MNPNGTPKSWHKSLDVEHRTISSFTYRNSVFSIIADTSSLKGATKSYFTHYSFLVFILFNTGLCKSAFSTNSFRKLVFFIVLRFLSFLPVMCRIWCNLHKLYNICTIFVWHVICVFALTYEKQFVNIIKILVQFLIKNMPLESF